VGDKLFIGDNVTIEHLEKSHPKAIPAQIVRLGITAPDNVKITRKELL
jgi:sRNA-binding carbon storage regulator CsrA